MLEVGAVQRPRRPHHDRGLALGRGRDRAQRGEQQRRVVVDRPHAIGGEQLRNKARHRDAVLEHVGDARGRAHVVLQHLPAAVGVAHQVTTGHVRVDAAGRAHAVHGPGEVGAADDQRPGHDAGMHDLAGVVDVVDEVVERAHALGQAALDVVPLLGRDDPRDQIERERAVAHRAVLALRIEGDALLREDRVAAVTGGEQALAAQIGQLGGQRIGIRPRLAVLVEDLVIERARDPVGVRRRGGIRHRTRLMPGPNPAAHRHLSKRTAVRLDRASMTHSSGGFPHASRCSSPSRRPTPGELPPPGATRCARR